jgi:hypothetical protein
MVDLELHKQIVNRILEPFAWMTVVCTATEYANFFQLRCDKAAQPEIRRLALLMFGAYRKSEPVKKDLSAWHLPYVTAEERATLDLATCLAISTGRCGRVSYVRQGEVFPVEKDVEWHDRALKSDPKHLSPFEHQAQAQGSHMWNQWTGNFYGGWKQYRKSIPGESGMAVNLDLVWETCAEEVEELLRAA